MRIAFVHDWNVHYQQELDWQDGLSAALHELRRRGYTVELFVCGDHSTTIPNPYHTIIVTPNMPASVRSFAPDVILYWGDMTRPNAKPLHELNVPMACCFAGGEPDSYNTYEFDHIFVESQVYKDKFDALDIPCSIAFGTNTNLFTPLSEQVKAFDSIFPATFAAWKRHNLYARATHGLRSLACGYLYTDHEQDCWQECLRYGVTVLPHVSAQVLRYLYAASRVCVVPSRSDGGSQRTVLEAMAMNIPLIVCDSDKFDYLTKDCTRVAPEPEALQQAVYARLNDTVDTRAYVLEHWSHIQYADELEKGLTQLCQHKNTNR